MNPEFPTSRALLALATTVEERRAAYELQERERESERRQKLDSQVSALRSPYERICIWEELHRVHLPLQLGHPLVDVIANQTELSVQQIEVEQRRRTVLRSKVPV